VIWPTIVSKLFSLETILAFETKSMKINLKQLRSQKGRKSAKNLLIIFLLSTAFVPFTYNGSYDSIGTVAIVVFWSFTIFLTQFLGHGYIIEVLDKRISWVECPFYRAAVGVVFIVLYASLAFMAVNLLMNLVFFQRVPYDSLQDAIDSSWFAVKIAFVISFVLTSIGFFQAWKNSEVAKEQLNTQIVTHKYNALRDQINPHFLFNSLNVLSDLVYEDQELAVKFIRQMSDLYRYVLMVKNEDSISLAREKEFAESFSFLLKTRFEKGLEIQMDFEPKPNEHIVPMALQLLIENAVKHNEASSQNPLSVKVVREGDFLKVINNLQSKSLKEESTKKGLENLKNRYAFLSDQTLEIRESKEHFEVLLPILNVEA